MSATAWVFLLVLLVAVPVAALLFTALWVVRLVRKYRLFSEDAEDSPEEKEGEEKPAPPENL